MKKRQQEALDRAPVLRRRSRGQDRQLGRVPRHLRSHQGQPGLVRDRSARRQDSADAARGASRASQAARGGSFGNGPVQRSRRLQPVGALHHARAAGIDAARASTATRIRSCRRPGSSPSATRWFTRRASFRSTRVRTSAATLRFDMGDARGHWEGDTLVVETTNFKQRSAYRNANADTLRLVERFTRDVAGHGRVVGHRRRSVDLDAAVDVLRCR